MIEYKDSDKTDIHQDWRKFANRILFPHTQTCAHCNGVFKVNNVTELDAELTGRQIYNYMLPPRSKNSPEIRVVPSKPTFLFYRCPGCNKPQRLEEPKHVSSKSLDFLKERMVEYAYKNKTFEDYELALKCATIAVALILIVGMVFIIV